MRRHEPQTWPVKDINTDINPLIYTEEHFFIICRCRQECKLELFVHFIPRLVAGQNFVTKQLEQIYCSVIYPFVSCLVKTCAGNVTELHYDSAHLSWILLWLYINFSRTHLQISWGFCRHQTLWILVLLFLLNIFLYKLLLEHLRVDRIIWRNYFPPLYTGLFHYEEHCTVFSRIFRV